MADTLKVLAQLAPSATTLTDAYTVPGSTMTTFSSVVVCNRGASSATFRISIAVSGAADATKQYTHYDVPVPANDTYIATIGYTAAATDILRVYAGNSNLSFSVFGVEVTATSIPYTLNFNPIPSDVTASGLEIDLTAGENLSFGDVCYLKSDGKMWKADANGTATYPTILLAAATISANATGTFLILGIARNDAWNWTVGGVLYLSTTAGSITQTQPSATDDVIQVLGFASHADRIIFKASVDYMTHT